MSSPHWTATVGRLLACEPDETRSDAIVIDNVDTRYLPFERAVALRNAGVAPRILVPVWEDADSQTVNLVSSRVTAALASLARLDTYDVIGTKQQEPIALNVARDVRRFVLREHIRSITIVSPRLRSRRSALVYANVLEPAGIEVHCVPDDSAEMPGQWRATWHGMQEVLEQSLKLAYYRLWVLPRSWASVSR